jgi:hypothetical protein
MAGKRDEDQKRARLHAIEAIERGDPKTGKLGIHAQISTLHAQIASGKTMDGEHDLSDAEKAKLQAQLRMLESARKQLLDEKVQMGFSTREDVAPKGKQQPRKRWNEKTLRFE